MTKWFARGFVLAAMVMGTACGATDGFEADDAALLEGEAGKADGIAATSTFYKFRHDMRRCISPMCGGYFMSRVNYATTKCADGTWKAECYVAEMDTRAIGDVAISGNAILRGDVRAKTFSTFGNMGQFVVREAWAAANDRAATGTFYRLSDSGIRCVRAPCNSLHEAKLNSTAQANVSDIDFTATGASAAQIAAARQALVRGGFLAAGTNTTARDGGTVLAATQLYRRLTGVQADEKACTHNSDCVLTAVTHPVNDVDGCYCARCPAFALNKTAAASYQDSYTAFCSDQVLRCPMMMCIQPPPVACVNRLCVTQPR